MAPAIFAGVATIATLALFSTARPSDAETLVPSTMRLIDQATELPAPETVRTGSELTQTPP